jgi:predicted nucleotidyltransferase
MVELLEHHREAIVDLCRKHWVKRLDVFGSATGPSFDPDHSDVDLLITMHDVDAIEYKRRYLAFWEEIESLLGRHVDLVTEKYIHNPYFLSSVNQSRVLLYAA